jgi:hypothetical protein
MTHDELLAKIDADQEVTEYLDKGLVSGDITINTARQHWFQSNALRAVVELHKPEPLDERGDVCLTCCPDLLTLYPCPTIQAIEKELS